MPHNIEPLKKVTLSLVASTAPGLGEPTPRPLTFVYGVASSGFCPFESALYGRMPGEEIDICVQTTEAGDYFGHIFHSLREALDLAIMPAVLCLTVRIVTVEDAADREVVQAVAKALASCGCGGSCGC